MNIQLIVKDVPKSSESTRIRYKIDKTIARDMGMLEDIRLYLKTYVVKQNSRFSKLEYNPCKNWTLPRFLLHPFCKFMKMSGHKVFTSAPVFKNEEIDLPKPIDLWEEKITICNDVYSKIKKTGGCVLKFGAGAGKTMSLCQIMHQMKVKTVIICMNTDLATQMYNDIIEYTGINPDRVGRVGGDYKYEEFTKDIYVFVINSAMNLDISLFGYFGMMVFDEIHEFCAPGRSLVMKNSPCQYMFGMTATPEKHWNWTALTHRCGELHNANITVKEEIFNCDVTLLKYHGPPEYTMKLVNKTGNMCCSYMADQFADDEKRNLIISERIINYINDGLSGLVFTTTKKHVKTLHERFASYYPNVKIGLIYSDVPKSERKEIAENADVIFTTYKCCGTGFNQPRLRFIIKAGPHKDNGGQIDWRIFRGKSDDEKRYIVDIVDQLTSLKSQLYSRKKHYGNHNIIVENIYSNDIEIE